MKILIRATALVGAVLLLTGCASGEVTDKRAPGQPGEKVFQLRIDGTLPDHWVTVSENVWEACSMYEQYPGCKG
jgi:hypothetical protein